jgi:hypothetical protein
MQESLLPRASHNMRVIAQGCMSENKGSPRGSQPVYLLVNHHNFKQMYHNQLQYSKPPL